MMTELEMLGKRARMYSDLTTKLAEARRLNDENEVTVNELRKIVLYLMQKIDMAVVLTDEELEKISGRYDLKIFPNIHNELVIKAEKKKNPHGNADSVSVTSEVAI